MKINNGDLEIFVAQVAPGQNQHTKNASWDDAWGDRVKIRIPGKHTETSEIKDDDLPWAIVAKPTGTGHFNRASSGIWGGEWVLCIHNPKISQEPTIIGNYGRAANMPEIVASTNGTTAFKDVSTYNGGLQAGPHQMSGGSSKRSDPRTLPIGNDIKEDAKTDPTSQTDTEQEATTEDPTEDPLALVEFTGEEGTTSSGGGSSRSTTQTAADVLNRDPKSISQYGTRINNTPTVEQLEQLNSSGLTFTPNADGSPGGKVDNPNSLLGG